MKTKLAITIAEQNAITGEPLPVCYIIDADVPDNVAESIRRGELMSIAMVKNDKQSEP